MTRASLTLLGFVALTSIAGGSVMAVAGWLGPDRLGIPPEMTPPPTRALCLCSSRLLHIDLDFHPDGVHPIQRPLGRVLRGGAG
jgi:hypothetical protein